MLIIAFGDIHMDTKAIERIPELEQADCVVLTGDLTVVGGRREARRVLDAVAARNPRLYAQIGNMDRKEVDDMLSEQEVNLNGHGVVLDGVGLFGLGGSSPTPFGTPSEFSEAEMAGRLEQAFEEVKEARRKILFSHTPPIRTRLDRVRSGLHAGSQAVRDFLERTNCDACVCGHIHEAAGTERVGSCLVINPGMIGRGGYVRIHCDRKGVSASIERC
jgi:Icc-related predicted phosphoesterase